MDRSERETAKMAREKEKGETERGRGTLAAVYDRGLTRAKVARVTPSSY